MVDYEIMGFLHKIVEDCTEEVSVRENNRIFSDIYQACREIKDRY